MKKRPPSVVYIAIAIASGLSAMAFIVVFFVNFAGTKISDSISDWGAFGSYFSFITSIFNLIFFIILTYKASEIQEKLHYNQMSAQKIELQTSLRKDYIDDVRQRMLNLNSLTDYNILDKNEFLRFRRDCETLRRVFNIYERNKNNDLLGTCNYKGINEKFDVLHNHIEAGNAHDSIDIDQVQIITEVLNSVNEEIIIFEKSLSDFTISELTKAFSVSQN